MVDFDGVNTLRLRFPNGERDDLVLGPGVHAVGQDGDGRPCLVDQPQDTRLQVSIDRRGVWLQLREHAHGLHVNGRPVRRMAMLRAGDALHMDGMDLLLVGVRPQPVAREPVAGLAKRRMVLRALGGPHHGRCFDLDAECTVGSAADAVLCINEADIADRHSLLEPHAKGIRLQSLETGASVAVNGHRVADGLLLPGDQVVFGANHRFVLESPQVMHGVEEIGSPSIATAAPDVVPAPVRSPLVTSLRRLPWLLLAAVLLAVALALLLLYGAR
ncbi:MAG: FHA domain-containing protein [Lysobacter sp.]